jgi:hypothetical protein
MNISEIDFGDAHRQLYNRFKAKEESYEWYAYEILSAISNIVSILDSSKVVEIALIMEEIGILNARKIGTMTAYSVNPPK